MARRCVFALLRMKICGNGAGVGAAAGKTTGRVCLRSPKCYGNRVIPMKDYRILVSSGREFPEIVLPAAAPTPAPLPRLSTVFKED